MLSLLLLALLSLVLAGNNDIDFKFKTPNEQVKWYTTADVLVLWGTNKKDDSRIKNIDIDLMLGPGNGVLVDNVSFGVPAHQGLCEWIVDRNLPTRNDYFLRITSTDDPSFLINGPRFTIKRNSSKAASSGAEEHLRGASWSVVMAALLSFLAF